MKRCGLSFFNRPTTTVAAELLGKTMVFQGIPCIITETEAYVGENDPACHACRGMTKRNAVMYGRAGFTYVYFIYGMYNCLNFVTEEEGFPAAVLIRGVRMNGVADKKLNGPGKLCRHLGITREHSGMDLLSGEEFYVADTGLSLPFETTPRIGISAGKDRLWRFAAIPENKSAPARIPAET